MRCVNYAWNSSPWIGGEACAVGNVTPPPPLTPPGSRHLTGLRTGTWHMPILTETSLYDRPPNTSTLPPSKEGIPHGASWQDMMVLFPCCMGNGQTTNGLYESPRAPGRPGGCYSSEWLSFPRVWRSNHTGTSVCTDPRLFTLATSPAVGLLFSHFSSRSGKVLKAVSFPPPSPHIFIWIEMCLYAYMYPQDIISKRMTPYGIAFVNTVFCYVCDHFDIIYWSNIVVWSFLA